jgi:prolyl-tRNA synthetase
MATHDIHYLTTNLTKTTRSTANVSDGRNAHLLHRAGFISQVSAGNFALLPLGLRVLRRIESIVRDEMTAIGAQEILTPTLQPRHLFEASQRWDSIDVLYKLQSRNGGDFCLAATGEEVIASTAQHLIQSHRDLPLSMYQMTEKFRDEARPRLGLLRGRVFWMKDLYSLHATQEDLDHYYENVVVAYTKVFTKLGFGDRVKRTFASGGIFSRFSDEFQLIAESGEDTIYLTEDSSHAINKEVAEDADALRQLFGTSTPKLIEHRAIEVGNTFKLGTRFCDALGISFQDKDGQRRTPLMCSYGLGLTRAMGAVAEVFSDDRGLCWPKSITPYDVHIVVLGEGESVNQAKTSLVASLKASGVSALIDDRVEARAGEKFADADLIGIPTRVVIGGQYARSGQVEVKVRGAEKAEVVELDRLTTVLS